MEENPKVKVQIPHLEEPNTEELYKSFRYLYFPSYYKTISTSLVQYEKQIKIAEEKNKSYERYLGREAESVKVLAGMFVFGLQEDAEETIRYFSKERDIFYVHLNYVKNEEEQKLFLQVVASLFLKVNKFEFGDYNKYTKKLTVTYLQKKFSGESEQFEVDLQFMY